MHNGYCFRITPVDIRIEDFKDGPVYVDPTIAHVSCPRAMAFKSVQAWLDAKRKVKEKQYATRDEQHRLKTTLKFYAAVVSAFGGWDADAVKFVRELGKAKDTPPAGIFDSVGIVVARFGSGVCPHADSAEYGPILSHIRLRARMHQSAS